MGIDELEKEFNLDLEKRKISKKRINSKKKGNRAELELTKIFNARFEGENFKRTPSSGAIFGASNRSRAKNVNEEIISTLAGDIMCPLNFKYSIEHKAYESASFWDLFNESSNLVKWFKQVETDSSFSNKLPMLIVKYNRKKRICFIKEKLNKLDKYFFEKDGWYCYFLEDVLKEDDKFFFEENK